MKNVLLSFSLICSLLFAGLQNAHSQNCCNANFSARGIQKLTWSFSPEDLSNVGDFKWKWEFGDGGVSSKAYPTHTYSKSGTYSIKLTKTRTTIINQETVVASCAISKQVIIKPVYPPLSCFAEFTVTQTGNTVKLKNVSVLTAETITYKWNFGDGNTSTSANPTHAYLKPGTYDIKLTVTVSGFKQSAQSCTYSKTVSIQKKNCNSDFTYQTNLATVNFTQSASSSDFSLWTFGDGYATYGVNPTHTYSNGGTYTVCQYRGIDTLNILTSSCNTCKQITIDSIPVTPFDSCFANFTYQRVNNTVYIDGSASGSVSYENYDLGDGSYSYYSSPSHTYTFAGTYVVKRTVIKSQVINGNYYNDTCRYFQTIVIPVSTADSCFAVFSYDFVGDSVIFHSANAGYHSWSLGDGSYNYGTNPSHIYSAGGSYNVCHTLILPSGDSCTQCYDIIVPGKPVVSPNPADGYINISSPQDSIVSYALMNNAGTILASQNNIYALQTSVPVQNIPTGYYTLKVIYGYNRYAFYNVLVQH